MGSYRPTASEVAALYSMRSDLVHGTTLLDFDGPFGGGSLGFVSSEFDRLERLRAVVTVAVVRWLLEQGRQALEEQVALARDITATSPSEPSG